MSKDTWGKRAWRKAERAVGRYGGGLIKTGVEIIMALTAAAFILFMLVGSFIEAAVYHAGWGFYAVGGIFWAIVIAVMARVTHSWAHDIEGEDKKGGKLVEDK